MHESPAVLVKALRHRYAKATADALYGIDMCVATGSVHALLGRNGSGKTTLFKLLATQMTPRHDQSVGTADIFGMCPWQDPSAVRAQLGVVFQHPSVDIKLSAAENVWCQAKLYGLSGPSLAQAVDQALHSAGLANRRNDKVQTFSGGMRRRLEIAKAMLHRPRLLLLDEPDTGLDPAARDEVWQQLQTLRQQHGTTVLLTTHLMDLAERCDRVTILHQGHIVADDTPGHLRQQFAEEVVRIEPAHGDVQLLADDITQHFGPWPPGGRPAVVAGQVLISRDNAMALASAVHERYRPTGRLRSVAMGPAGLHDVFVSLTA